MLAGRRLRHRRRLDSPDGSPKEKFAFSAGIGGSTPPLGHLLYVNHVIRERLEGDVLVYAVTSTNSREMTGVGEVNGAFATFQLDVTDASEPGRVDTLRLTYSTGVPRTDFGTVGGGNIQIRPMCALS